VSAPPNGPAPLDEVRDRLATAGVEGAAAEAERIVRHAGGDRARALALADERAGGAPLAYLLGLQVFCGHELLAAPGALVPREETELLARAAVEACATAGPRPAVVDMCTGSGNLAVAIALAREGASVWASDLTDECVSLARRNVERFGLGGRVRVLQGDLFAPLAGLGLEGAVDVIVCNPPYISTGRLGRDRAELLRHEPREAFDGGPYGLTIHQRVVRDAAAFLRPDGWLLFEFGVGQERQLERLLTRGPYRDVAFRANAAGEPRVALARHAPPPGDAPADG
jgi:release factor glutamine methyltransferase